MSPYPGMSCVSILRVHGVSQWFFLIFGFCGVLVLVNLFCFIILFFGERYFLAACFWWRVVFHVFCIEGGILVWGVFFVLFLSGLKIGCLEF